MIAVHDDHSTGTSAVGRIDQIAALTSFRDDTFDRCGLRADDGDQTIG